MLWGFEVLICLVRGVYVAAPGCTIRSGVSFGRFLVRVLYRAYFGHLLWFLSGLQVLDVVYRDYRIQDVSLFRVQGASIVECSAVQDMEQGESGHNHTPRPKS